MPKRILLLLLLFAGAQQLSAQLPPSVLENYIHLGLDSNLALHQRNFDLERAQWDLKRAKALFYPNAGFSAQYTLADGGRTQEVPIGDLLNNVYTTLNQLTGSNKFPQVQNQSIQFLPNNFQDTKMEITLPILNTDLQHNKEVNTQMVNSRQADRDVYRRDLVRNIRQAYYQYLQAGKAVEIYTTALNLVKENRRVSQKFVENNMATRESVMRAQAQVSQVESSLIEATNNQHNAIAYFNCLLNRSLDSPIETDSTLMAAVPPTQQPSIEGGNLTNREEFNQIKSYQKILQSNMKWDRAYLIPKLNAFYDVGFQGFGYHFANNQFYQLAGIQLNWALFKAGDNKYKIRQAAIDLETVDAQYKDLTQQLNLQQQTTVNNYYSAEQALHSLVDEVSSARETYRLAERRFNEGNALQIELIDARTQMTNAELRYSLGLLTLLDRSADLERVMATYKF